MIRSGLLAGLVAALALLGFADAGSSDEGRGTRRELWREISPSEVDQIRDLLATIRQQQRDGESASVEQSATGSIPEETSGGGEGDAAPESLNSAAVVTEPDSAVVLTEPVNSAAVLNTGPNNDANVRQDGTGNKTTVGQNGTAISAQVAQSGTSHTADVQQGGNNLSVDLSQFGDHRSIGINQFGQGTGVPLIVRQY
jgi:Curlin associated repeat